MFQKKKKGRANAKQGITVKGGNLWNDLKIERKTMNIYVQSNI